MLALRPATAQAPAGAMLADFESGEAFSGWTFSNGPEFPGATGALTRDRGAAHDGDVGASLAFDFMGGGNYVAAYVPLPTDEPTTHVRLWLHKPTDHRLTVRATDSEGQTFQKGFSYDYAGWQEVLVSLSGWTGHWGGKNDGVFRGAARQFGLLVENTSTQKTGAVQFDDVRLIAGEEPISGAATTEYVACGFAEGGPFRGDTVRFDFSQGATSAGLGADFSLMGRPQSLSLKLRSSVAGHRLKMRIGSHFQGFERVLGELKTGEQTFEAELGSMATWTHGGGENDGVARMPLRVNLLSVERGKGPPKGEVKLLELRVSTQVLPEQRVILEPSGRIEGKDLHWSCVVRSLLDREVEGFLESRQARWSGKQWASGERRVRVPAGGVVTVPVVRGGSAAFAECGFRLRTDSAVYGPATATVVRGMDDAGDAALQPDSPFGMGLYLYRYPNNTDGFERMDRAAALAQAAGVKWSREEFQWHRIEPEKGKFAFDYYDKLVDTAHRHGISVYGLIAYWSGWAKAYTPEGIEDYANYCRALVARYKGKIKHWEVWNEPNIFFWSGPRELYCDLLRAAYRAIKEADPEAQVLGCSTAGIDRKFVERVMDSGAPFDILTIHPYRGHLDDAAFIKELRDTATLTAKADGNPKPVWITEMGWPTQLQGGVSEREQADLLARCYLCAVASGAAQSVSWYDFREDGNNPFYNEHHFGVVRSDDMSPKPAYRALATVCRTLAGQTVQEQLDLGEGVLGFRFAGAGRETVVVWSPSRPVVLGLGFDKAPAHVRDLMGGELKLPSQGDLRLLSLPAGSPVFMTGDRVRVASAKEAIRLEAPKAVHAGEAAVIGGEVADELAGNKLDLRHPFGEWAVEPRTVTADPAFEFRVNVPADAAPGAHRLNVWLRVAGSGVGLQLPIEVVSALLRV